MMSGQTNSPEDLAQFAKLKSAGEKAYDQMYEAHNFRDADDFYRDAKDCFYDAIGLASRLGLSEEASALTERLQHIKSIYRSQFSK